MAVVRPSAPPPGPPDAPAQRQYRLVPVPLSHRQAPLLAEPEPAPTPQELRPPSPQEHLPPQEQPPPQAQAAPRPVVPVGLKPIGRPRPEPTQPLSPELALVSPELAEEARASLPEPPWKELAPVLAAKRLLVDTPAPDRRPAPASRERRHVPGERVPPRRRPQLQLPRIPASTMVFVAIAAFMAVTGILPARDAPTLLTPAPKAKAAKPKPRASRQAASPLVAGAVYAEGDRLRLRVGENGRRLTGTTGPLPCAAGGVAFRAAVARDGSFRGTVRGRVSSATGTVLGRFGPRTTASGIMRVRLPDCDSGPVLFVAGVKRS
jgi:hypothetical protein